MTKILWFSNYCNSYLDQEINQFRFDICLISGHVLILRDVSSLFFHILKET